MRTSTQQVPLPNAMDVRVLAEGLLGRDVTVMTGAGAVNPREAPGAAVGVYVNNRLTLSAIIVVDFPLSAFIGAALGLVPVTAARAAIEDGVLSSAMFENVAEVLNIAASLFNREGAPHLRLHAAYAPGEALPSDVQGLSTAFVRRIDLELSVAGYGGGRISILAL